MSERGPPGELKDSGSKEKKEKRKKKDTDEKEHSPSPSSSKNDTAETAIATSEPTAPQIIPNKPLPVPPVAQSPPTDISQPKSDPKPSSLQAGPLKSVERAKSPMRSATPDKPHHASDGIHTACENANMEEVKKYLRDKKQPINVRDARGWVPLQCAAHAAMDAMQPSVALQALEICKLLIRTGADPRIPTRSENTVLHLLARVAPTNGPEWLEVRKSLKSTLQAAIERGADVNWKNNSGITPLHEAAFRGALDAATFLLEHNCDPNLKTKQGETSLHYAVRAGNEEMVKLLLAFKADPSIKSEAGTPIELSNSCKNELIKKVLEDALARSADIQRSLMHQTAEELDSELVVLRSVDTLPAAVVKMLKEAGIAPTSITEEQMPTLARVLGSHDKERDYFYLPGSDFDLWSKEDPRKLYKEIEVAGKGGYGRVLYMQKMDGSNYRVAVKKMEHLPHDRSGRKHNLNEVLTLRWCRHPNIVQFIASYRLKDEIWIAMEFLEGGTLETALQSTKFTEPQISFITKEILKALVFLHSKNRAHRDIKGANVMMSIAGAVKLIDFGLSADMTDGPRTDSCGTSYWLPPEMVLRRPHTCVADIWSTGIVVLEMANGEVPNRNSALKALWDLATKPPPTLNTTDSWSPDIKDFLSKALVSDPAKRSSAAELLEHQWFKNQQPSKSDMGKFFQRIFTLKTLDKMGLGIGF